MQDDEKQEESTLAQLMTQIIAAQAQQGKYIQLLMSELQQEWAVRKMLETQFAQQASSSSRNLEKFPSQPNVRSADANAITLKSGKVLKEPSCKGSIKKVKQDKQLEQGKKKVEEQETPYVAPPIYATPIPFPQRQIKVLIETIGHDNVVDVYKVTFDESELLSNKHAKNRDTMEDNLTEVVKKSFHEGSKIYPLHQTAILATTR